MLPAIAATDITGVVLAGGKGSRMGGADKGLQPFHGTPLALHALRRLQPQVGRAAINANRNIAAYEAFGVPVWPDRVPGYAGPLAGMLAALQHCQTPWLVTVPCDTPNFPPDLVQRLATAAATENAEIAMAFAPEADPATGILLSAQPVFCLMRVELAPGLQAFMAEGGRKVGAWAKGHRLARVAFNTQADDGHAFFNANTLAELQALAGGSLV